MIAQVANLKYYPPDPVQIQSWTFGSPRTKYRADGINSSLATLSGATRPRTWDVAGGPRLRAVGEHFERGLGQRPDGGEGAAGRRALLGVAARPATRRPHARVVLRTTLVQYTHYNTPYTLTFSNSHLRPNESHKTWISSTGESDVVMYIIAQKKACTVRI